MSDKSPELLAAEQALQAREKFKHDVEAATGLLRQAELSGDTARIKTAQTGLAAAIKARDDAGVTDRELDELAQAVLDASNQAHTETNVLPSDHGIRTVMAAGALSDAIARKYQPGIPVAEKALAEAQRLDAEEKAAHVAESTERTKVALAEVAAELDAAKS